MRKDFRETRFPNNLVNVRISRRVQQIADWISVVEKAISAQPEWVGYY